MPFNTKQIKPFYSTKYRSTTVEKFSSPLLNYIERVNVDGIYYTKFYSSINTNFSIGDKVFIVNGTYDSYNLILENSYQEHTTGYEVIQMDKCGITLNIEWVGNEPSINYKFDELIKIYVTNPEFNYNNRNYEIQNNILYPHKYVNGIDGNNNLLLDGQTFKIANPRKLTELPVNNSTWDGDVNYFTDITPEIKPDIRLESGQQVPAYTGNNIKFNKKFNKLQSIVIALKKIEYPIVSLNELHAYIGISTMADMQNNTNINYGFVTTLNEQVDPLIATNSINLISFNSNNVGENLGTISYAANEVTLFYYDAGSNSIYTINSVTNEFIKIDVDPTVFDGDYWVRVSAGTPNGDIIYDKFKLYVAHDNLTPNDVIDSYINDKISPSNTLIEKTAFDDNDNITSIIWSNELVLSSYQYWDTVDIMSNILPENFTKNNGKILPMSDFTYNNITYKKGTIYYFNDEKNKWLVDISYIKPYITLGNLRNGSFNESVWNDGVFGQSSEQTKWGDNSEWESGILLNAELTDTIISSKSDKLNAKSYYAFINSQNEVKQSSDFSNNSGFGYNFIDKSILNNVTINNGTFTNSLIGEYTYDKSLINKYTYDNSLSGVTFSTSVLNGKFVNSNIIGGNIDNATFDFSYINNSISNDGSYNQTVINNSVTSGQFNLAASINIIGYNKIISSLDSFYSDPYQSIKYRNTDANLVVIHKFYISEPDWININDDDISSVVLTDLVTTNPSFLDIFDNDFKMMAGNDGTLYITDNYGQNVPVSVLLRDKTQNKKIQYLKENEIFPNFTTDENEFQLPSIDIMFIIPNPVNVDNTNDILSNYNDINSTIDINLRMSVTDFSTSNVQVGRIDKSLHNGGTWKGSIINKPAYIIDRFETFQQKDSLALEIVDYNKINAEILNTYNLPLELVIGDIIHIDNVIHIENVNALKTDPNQVLGATYSAVDGAYEIIDITSDTTITLQEITNDTIITLGTTELNDSDFDAGGWLDINDDTYDCTVFISTWKTWNNQSLVTDIPTITLPYLYDGVYDGVINWGDGTTSTNSYANRSHVYQYDAIYTITVTGTIEGFNFLTYSSSAYKIFDVSSWGKLKLNTASDTSAWGHFISCYNLNISATDAPDLSNTTSLISTFRFCETFNSNISHWDTSNVTTMLYMFSGAVSFNQPLNFDTSNVITMDWMFNNAISFNQPLNFDTSNVTDMEYMFHNAESFNQPLNLDTSNVTTMNGMFYDAVSFNQPLNLDTSNVIYMNQMFGGAVTFNQPLNFDTSNVIYMFGMFDRATSFNQDISLFNFNMITRMDLFMYNKGSEYEPLYYDALLENWSTSTTLSNMDTNMGAIKYTSAGAVFRADLITRGWEISDGGQV